MKSTAAFALRTGAQLGKIGWVVMHRGAALTTATKDGVVAAKRAMRRGWYAAGDCADEMAMTIKRRPLKAIGLTFGVAFAAGAVTGWLRRGNGK
jgi:hypothetical protein